MRFLIAGGLTRGLLDAGIEVVAGFARDPQRQATCERNNRPAKFDLSAIRDLCRAAMALPPPAVRHGEFLLAACAPCATAGASGSPRRSPRPPGPPAKSVLQARVSSTLQCVVPERGLATASAVAEGTVYE